MNDVRTVRRLGAGLVLVASLALAGEAPAACSDTNWKDCKGKPWVSGDSMETPIGDKWWPNPMWGAGDEAGSTNWYTKPEVVMRAIAQIKEGKTYRLAHEYHSGMPLFGERKFVLRIPATPTGGPYGGNKIVWHDEFLATEIGQVGTQFDGLGHIGVQIGHDGDRANMRFYNGFTEAEMGTAYGLKKLGTEKLHPIVARGVLIDLTLVKEWDKGQCATVDDMRAALAKQGMADFKFEDGDALLFRFGWERHWEDAATFNSGEPGLCAETAHYIASLNPGVTGGDSWAATDPVPYPDGEPCAFCIHQILQTRHGIVNQENLRLKQLADDGVWVFAYIFAPAPIRGATGSIGSPIAIR